MTSPLPNTAVEGWFAPAASCGPHRIVPLDPESLRVAHAPPALPETKTLPATSTAMLVAFEKSSPAIGVIAVQRMAPVEASYLDRSGRRRSR